MVVRRKVPPSSRLREHVVLVEEGEVVAGDEVGLVDQVGGDNLVLAETQMAGGDRARFLGVVDKVALGGVVGLGADDLDGVLVGADCAVGAQAVEHGPDDVLALDVEGPVVAQAGAGHVVVGADAEVVLGGHGGHVVEDRLDHGRGELGRTQAVTAGEDQGLVCGGIGLHRLADCGADVQIERLAGAARFLGAVEHGDAS